MWVLYEECVQGRVNEESFEFSSVLSFMVMVGAQSIAYFCCRLLFEKSLVPPMTSDMPYEPVALVAQSVIRNLLKVGTWVRISVTSYDPGFFSAQCPTVERAIILLVNTMGLHGPSTTEKDC